MKHFSLKIAGLNGVAEVAKFSCAKVSTAQQHAHNLIADRNLTLSMIESAHLYCGDGQTWADIGNGKGFYRLSGRSHW
jgi:hypothetical protein